MDEKRKRREKKETLLFHVGRKVMGYSNQPPPLDTLSKAGGGENETILVLVGTCLSGCRCCTVIDHYVLECILLIIFIKNEYYPFPTKLCLF